MNQLEAEAVDAASQIKWANRWMENLKIVKPQIEKIQVISKEQLLDAFASYGEERVYYRTKSNERIWIEDQVKDIVLLSYTYDIMDIPVLDQEITLDSVADKYMEGSSIHFMISDDGIESIEAKQIYESIESDGDSFQADTIQALNKVHEEIEKYITTTDIILEEDGIMYLPEPIAPIERIEKMDFTISPYVKIKVIEESTEKEKKVLPLIHYYYIHAINGEILR